MHPVTWLALAAGVLMLAKLFHMSWGCPPAPPVPAPQPAVQPAAPVVQQRAAQVPYSTFGGDNPLAQPGLLAPQPPTSPNAFIPLPPVKY